MRDRDLSVGPSPLLEKLVLKAWSDPAFKASLFSDSAAALASLGMRVPVGMTLKVLENTENLDYVVLPVRPAGELSDEQVAAATGFRLESTTGGNPEFVPFCKWCSFCIDLVKRAWTHPDFKTKLLREPVAAVMDAGAVVREGEVINVVENTDKLVHIVLPLQPAGELSDEALELVSAGTAACWIATTPTAACWIAVFKEGNLVE